MQKYFRDAGIIAFAEALLQLRHLFLIPFITRRFGAVDYGAWSQIAVLIATLSPLITLGTAQAALRYFPGLDVKIQRRYLSAWIVFLLFTAGIVILPVVFWPDAISETFFGASKEYVSFLPLAALSLLLSQMVSVVKVWFRIVNDAVLFSATNIGREVLQITATVIMLATGKGVYELIIYSIIADTVLVIITLGINYSQYGIGKPDFSIIPKMISFGLPLVPLAFSNWGLNYLDRIFLVQISLETVGVYSLAYSISNQVIPVMLRPFWSMFPSTAAGLYNQGKQKELQNLYERSAGTAFLFTLPASVGLALIASRLILLLSTTEFAGGSSVVLFVALGAMMNTFGSFYAVTLGLVHKQYLSLVANVAALVVNFTLNVLLIPSMGILGAAIATFAAFATLLGILVWFSNSFKIVKTDLRFPFKVVLASVIMAAGVTLVDRLWLSHLGNMIVEIGIIAIIGGGLYLVSLLLLRVITLADLAKGRTFLNQLTGRRA